MSTIVNIKLLKTWLIKKNLYEFVKEMWDSYETSPFSDCWLIQYLCECYQYSIKHFLPQYIWGEWISDEEYEKIQKESGGHCDVRDHLLPDGTHTRNHDLNIAPRHMKLLANNTPILTRNGWKNHGDLVVGDEVISDGGRFVKVIKVHPKDVADLEVVFSNGETIKCNSKHLWKVHDNFANKVKIVETEYLVNKLRISPKMGNVRGNGYRFHLENRTAILGEDKVLPVNPYVLGAWLGDGDTNHQLITAGIDDMEVINEVEKHYRIHNKWINDCGWGKSIQYEFDKIMRLDLQKLSLCFPKDKDTKHIPQEYLTASVEQRLDLLAGLIDTDGSLIKDEHRYFFITTSERLKDDILTLIASFGWKTSITIQKADGIISKKDGYYIGFNPTFEIPCRIPRKQLNIFSKQRRISITSINKLDIPEEGNCITVEGGMYLAGRTLIQTHNSTIMNVLGPAWTIINTPITVTSVSHSKNLSGEMIIKKQKLFNSEKYKYYFGNEINLGLSKNTADCLELRNGGKTYSVAMDKFTGFGSDCFVAKTRILSKNGYTNIEDLNVGDIVTSYNLQKCKYEDSKVVARRVIEDRETGIITTDSGRQIECTSDHRFWVEDRGYQKVCDIKEGSRIKICSLQSMWENDTRLKRILQDMLWEFNKESYLYEMQLLWEYCNTFFTRIDEASSKGEDILLKELFIESEQLRETYKCNLSRLSTMWKNWSSKFSDILFSRVQDTGRTEEKSNTRETNRSLLQELWQIVFSACEFKQNVLFSRMCKSDAFKEDDGGQQSKLQRSISRISSRILGQESKYFGEGWLLLSMLSCTIDGFSIQQEWQRIYENKFSSSPQRQRHIQQFRSEFSNIMSNLSYKDTQERIREWKPTGERKTVYDIQVEPNNNFFANDVLVHNCIINDDLISVADARMDGAVLLHARDYYKTTMPSRLNNKTTGVIWHIMQRIGNGDISDLIAEDKGLRLIYSHTEIQAVASHDQTFIYPCSGMVKQIKKGDLLWAERFGDYTQLKMEIGSEDFETQYNQNPGESRLNVIKENMIHYIEDKELEEFTALAEFHYASHDCPVKDKETSDYHGFTEAYSKDNELVITDAFEEHLGYVAEKELFTRMQIIDPSIIQVVEDKANGSALIQDLAKDVAGLVAFNPGTRSKMQRLELASVYMEKGLVRFARTDKVMYLIQQLKKFPLIAHDDITDAFAQLVIYHFTQRQLGVYTGAFSSQNIISSEEINKTNFLIYGATISGEIIKVTEIMQDNFTDEFIVVGERVFRGIQAFEEFSRNEVLPGNTILDTSPQNRLSMLLTNVYNVIKYDERDRDVSINIMKTGLFKKKIKVSKECKQTINDIAKLRITEQSRERGVDQTNTLDEGMAGCLRCVVTYVKGYSQQWY